MSALREDFDRIALVSPDGAAHNDHYHNFLLRQLPPTCGKALDIGCGTGTFARRLAERCQQVIGLDLSPEMIRLAREQSAHLPNIEFQLANALDVLFHVESFDCIATIATLHHLPFGEMLTRIKTALKPGGILLVLDLFEPQGLTDSLLNLVALPMSMGLRLVHYGRLLPQREARAAWSAHERHDTYLKMSEVRSLCARLLPGAKIKKHLLWRYSLVWRKA